MNKINLKLAEELREAGFPQLPRQHTLNEIGTIMDGGSQYAFGKKNACLFECFLTPEKYDEVVKHKDTEVIIKFPTLEELIEACGDEFIELHQWFEHRVGEFEIHKEWRVRVKSSIQWISGKTPSEAVANLWLKLQLNKK